jgi:hypothetical protein
MFRVPVTYEAICARPGSSFVWPILTVPFAQKAMPDLGVAPIGKKKAESRGS